MAWRNIRFRRKIRLKRKIRSPYLDFTPNVFKVRSILPFGGAFCGFLRRLRVWLTVTAISRNCASARL